MKRIGLTVLAVAFLMLGAGCGGDDSTGPGPGLGNGGGNGDGNGGGNGGGNTPAFVGELTYAYTGALSGEFEAKGGWSQSDGWDDAFAVATLDKDKNFMAVTAFAPTSATTGDMVVIVIDGATVPGTYTVEEGCVDDCVAMLFYFGVSTEHKAVPTTRAFIGLEGQTVATEVGKDITGTFAANAFEVLGEQGELTISDGTFSVPVVDVTVPSPQGFLAPAYANVARSARIDGLDELSPRMREIVLDFLDRMAGEQGM